MFTITILLHYKLQYFFYIFFYQSRGILQGDRYKLMKEEFFWGDGLRPLNFFSDKTSVPSLCVIHM